MIAFLIYGAFFAIIIGAIIGVIAGSYVGIGNIVAEVKASRARPRKRKKPWLFRKPKD